jgi:hypothetical protein
VQETGGRKNANNEERSVRDLCINHHRYSRSSPIRLNQEWYLNMRHSRSSPIRLNQGWYLNMAEALSLSQLKAESRAAEGE